MNKLKVVLKKSLIGCTNIQRANVAGLGLSGRTKNAFSTTRQPFVEWFARSFTSSTFKNWTRRVERSQLWPTN